MTIKEQIAKAIILKFDNDGCYKKYFDVYDRDCNEKWFISKMKEKNNFEEIIWEFGNLKDINVPHCFLRKDLNFEYSKKMRKELDEIINQFVQ